MPRTGPSLAPSPGPDYLTSEARPPVPVKIHTKAEDSGPIGLVLPPQAVLKKPRADDLIHRVRTQGREPLMFWPRKVWGVGSSGTGRGKGKNRWGGIGLACGWPKATDHTLCG